MGKNMIFLMKCICWMINDRLLRAGKVGTLVSDPVNIYTILLDVIPQCIKELGENHLTTIRLQYEQALECYNMGYFEEALSLLTPVKKKLRYHDEIMHEALDDLLILDCRKGLANSEERTE